MHNDYVDAGDTDYLNEHTWMRTSKPIKGSYPCTPMKTMKAMKTVRDKKPMKVMKTVMKAKTMKAMRR